MTKTFEVGDKTFTEGEEMRYEFALGAFVKVIVIGPWGTTNVSVKCHQVACWFTSRVVSCDHDLLSPIPPPTVMVELGVEDVRKWLVPKFYVFGPEERRMREACLEALIEAGEA